MLDIIGKLNQAITKGMELDYGCLSPWVFFTFFKVGLSLFRKKCVICFFESPLKIMKNAFYFILKAFFVLKIFNFLSRLFGHAGKKA